MQRLCSPWASPVLPVFFLFSVLANSLPNANINSVTWKSGNGEIPTCLSIIIIFRHHGEYFAEDCVDVQIYISRSILYPKLHSLVTLLLWLHLWTDVHTCWSLFRLLQSHWASSCSLNILSSFLSWDLCSWWSLSLEGPVILFYASFSLFKGHFYWDGGDNSKSFSPLVSFLSCHPMMFLQSLFPYISDYVVHLMACCFLSWPRMQAPWIQRPCVVQSALYPGTCLRAWLTGVLRKTRGMVILSFISWLRDVMPRKFQYQ